MELKVGDYVLVKDGTVLAETEVAVYNWGGQVMEIVEEDNLCLIIFDAITLHSLDDDYIIDAILDGTSYDEYYFFLDELVKSERRDTDEELELAYDEINRRINELNEQGMLDDDEEYEPIYSEDELDEWFDEFANSPFYSKLNVVQKKYAQPIVLSFLEIVLNVYKLEPDEWDVKMVREICLEQVPANLLLELPDYREYANVLIEYMAFLQENGQIFDAVPLQRLLKEIKHLIAKKESDTRNWSDTKLIHKLATSWGYDLTVERDVLEFYKRLARLQLDDNKNMFDKNSEYIQVQLPLQTQVPADFSSKKIERNQKVTVEYSDGSVKSEIKYKHVEKDLLYGKCKLIAVH